MIRNLLLAFGIITALVTTSCRDDFEFQPSTGGLEFSKNTVYLDTVFTNIGSSTYRLKVYNRSDNDINIPKIQLEKGTNSKFRIMIDGMTGDAGATGKIFSNVEMKAKDSMFIFIEVTADVADANPTDFLYTDKIVFNHGNGSQQHVDLVTLIQDAIFIYPDRTQSGGTYYYEAAQIDLDGNGQNDDIAAHNLSGSLLNWTNAKPYVVYGFAFVPDNETLTIAAGTRVYFHANSGIMVAQNGKFIVNGQNPSTPPLETDLTNEVIFEGDRLEYSFDNVPGQWFGIMNFSTKAGNSINHLTIKNATIGLYNRPLDIVANPNTARMTITNSKIQNCSYAGLYALASEINGENLVINNCGQACLGLSFGGKYSFNHCTFNNNWYSNKHAAVYLDDYLDDTTINDFITTTFTDCIMYGSNQKEVITDFKNTANFLNFTFTNNLIKYNSSTPFPFAGNSNIFNQDPKFKNISKHQLWFTTAIMAASNSNFDILGVSNTNIGAYAPIP